MTNNSILSSKSTNQKIAIVVPVLNDKLTITEAAIIRFSQNNPTVLLSFIIDSYSKKTIILLKNIQAKCSDNIVINIHVSFTDRVEAIRQGILFVYNHTNVSIIGFLDPSINLSLENCLSMAKYQEQYHQFGVIFDSRIPSEENLGFKKIKAKSEQFANTFYKAFEKVVLRTNF